MKGITELGPVQPGETVIEYVGGTRDGERHLVPIVVRAGETIRTAHTPADERIADSGERYVRRSAVRPQRCPFEGTFAAWHYDLERPVRRARPAEAAE